MSELRFETVVIPTAPVGPASPLPPLRREGLGAAARPDASVPAEVAGGMGYGRVSTILPYSVQDGYTRELAPTPARVAVLENETLRATFLLDWGGRLRSLRHKPTGRELLDVNPVLRPSNLALRGAWTSGGVEWNIGTIGHCPFTCASLFAAPVRAADGTPILRLWEWERIRGLAFQLDASLPDGSPALLVRVRITNPHAETVPMYWWSNIAVPEAEGTRVVVPADKAYGHDGVEHVTTISVPLARGVDVTRPRASRYAADFFFHVPDASRRWVAAIDADGTGLFQASTDLLVGRKLFVWGTNRGGRNWQTFLSVPGQAYLEIQAGLARTQMEHVPMPPGADWSWTEAYGMVAADPRVVHGTDWKRAVGCVADAIEGVVSRAALEHRHAAGARDADAAPGAPVVRGSGWGALELLRRGGARAFHPPGVRFDDESLGPEQAPWVALLRDGAFPPADPLADPPGGFMVQTEWHQMLREALASGRGGAPWLGWYHLGVMHAHDGRREEARGAWLRSLDAARSPWALYALACLEAEERHGDEVERLAGEALRMRPADRALAIGCATLLLAAGRPAAWLGLAALLPPGLRASGRLRLLEGQAALLCGDLARAEAVISEEIVVGDQREGEITLLDLWVGCAAMRLSEAEGVPVSEALRARVLREMEVPAAIDFRVSEGS